MEITVGQLNAHYRKWKSSLFFFLSSSFLFSSRFKKWRSPRFSPSSSNSAASRYFRRPFVSAMLNENKISRRCFVRETSIPIIRARASVVSACIPLGNRFRDLACLSPEIRLPSTIHLEISYARQSWILILRIISRFKRYIFDRILDSPLGIRREYLLNRITFSLSLYLFLFEKPIISPLNAHGYD